ncbi:AMP-binding protein [Hoeflea poritis]|uniref:AMP-binding protein n=1 Tax=Hoeflea poritis TaxID=2993659 RepID=A0ABT4VK68_9HYPH|nr:AMP-binding protein [Hoeflea poritis]MDA4845097.1 AMP-binding protein [Hoeflea poritis]
MGETAALAHRLPARTDTLLSLIDHWAKAFPGAPALGALDYAALRNESTHDGDTAALTTVESHDPLVAVPSTLIGLADGAVAFSAQTPAGNPSPGELLFPVRRDLKETDFVRMPQNRLIAMAMALAKRYEFSRDDRIYLSGPFDDPGTWLALVAAIYAGTPISLDPEGATLLWILDGSDAVVDSRTRVLHLRTTSETFADMHRRHPELTLVNGLALPEGCGLPICSDPRDPPHTVSTTLGRPLGGTEVMIVDPRTGMDRLLYEAGEVWLRGKGLMTGYASGSRAFEAARFLPTGILGYLDSEGRLVLSDGKSDLDAIHDDDDDDADTG